LALTQRELEKEKQSQAVKTGLPRPALPQTMLFPASFLPDVGGQGSSTGQAVAAPNVLLQQAESLLNEEMAALVTHDAFAFPIQGARPPKKPADLEDFHPVDLSAAKDLLTTEVAKFDAAAGSELFTGGALQAALDEGLGHLAYLPQAKRYVEWRMIGKEARLEAAKHMFKTAEAQVQRDSKRAKKLEDKLERVLGGYVGKARQSVERAMSLFEERETIGAETEVFQTLSLREEKAIESRVLELQEALDREKHMNARLQTRFRELRSLQQRLDAKLQ